MELNNIQDNEIKQLLQEYQNAVEIDGNELEKANQENQQLENEILETEKPKKRRNKKEKIESEINLSNVLSSETLLLIVDLLLPVIFAFVGKILFKKKIKTEKLRLTPDEMERLKPLADKALEKMNFEANPVTFFFTSLILIYITKLINE